MNTQSQPGRSDGKLRAALLHPTVAVRAGIEWLSGAPADRAEISSSPVTKFGTSVRDVCHESVVARRAMVMQQKTQRPPSMAPCRNPGDWA